MVATGRAAPLLCQRLEDRAEPLRQSGSRDSLARSVGSSPKEAEMERKPDALATAIRAALGFAVFCLVMPQSAATAETPKYGGVLSFMIPADAPPSFDGHREATFATVHAVAPFYSVLVRVNPADPASPTDFVCDVCTEIPEPGDGGRTYAFTIRDDVKFSDGSALSAGDVAASWNKIVNPPEGVISPRRGYYSMIERI